jgi:hypothetical protein
LGQQGWGSGISLFNNFSREFHMNSKIRIIRCGLGIVAHFCNPRYLGGVDRRFVVIGQPGAKM